LKNLTISGHKWKVCQDPLKIGPQGLKPALKMLATLKKSTNAKKSLPGPTPLVGPQGSSLGWAPQGPKGIGLSENPSLAPCFFPGLISGQKFFKLRQSTAFYPGHTTIFRAQTVLSGTYFFFASKSRKKSAGIGDEKKYFKNKIFKKKVAENFLLD